MGEEGAPARPPPEVKAVGCSILLLVRREGDGRAGGVIGKVADVPGGGNGPVSGLTGAAALVVLGKRGLVLGPVVLGHGVSSFSLSS
jgi:hypothetical protein